MCHVAQWCVLGSYMGMGLPFWLLLFFVAAQAARHGVSCFFALQLWASRSLYWHTCLMRGNGFRQAVAGGTRHTLCCWVHAARTGQWYFALLQGGTILVPELSIYRMVQRRAINQDDGVAHCG